MRTRGLHLRLLQAALAVALLGCLFGRGTQRELWALAASCILVGDALHLVTAAAWVGGLVPLLMFLGPRSSGHQPPLIDCFQCLRRFSTLAAWSVTVLAAGGVLNTWFMTNGLRSFLGTEYGDLVLVKIALFSVMLGFGAANRYWLTPRLLTANVSTEEECESTAAALHFGFD